MELDILAALEGTAPARADRKCKIQRWLDDISADQPGKDALVAALTDGDPGSPNYRTLPQLASLVSRLGLATDVGTIGDHRSGERCMCFR